MDEVSLNNTVEPRHNSHLWAKIKWQQLRGNCLYDVNACNYVTRRLEQLLVAVIMRWLPYRVTNTLRSYIYMHNLRSSSSNLINHLQASCLVGSVTPSPLLMIVNRVKLSLWVILLTFLCFPLHMYKQNLLIRKIIMWLYINNITKEINISNC